MSNEYEEDGYYYQYDQEEGNIEYNMANRISCPECGSRNYIEATKTEVCYDCGYCQSYW